MGASASGKSILMKVLAGRLQNLYINGDVSIDGSPMDPYDVKNEVSYVPQDDFLMGELSARESLTNNYMMKDPSSPEAISDDVQALLKSFGIDHVADTMIGTVFFRGISGGQRKRVEVCSELICPTSILLLDEPTSGKSFDTNDNNLLAIPKHF
jgi:ABC-type multidrug transport system ATPase subunit